MNLFDYLKHSETISFEWGTNDCCLWVARYVDLVKGTSITREWLGLYNTADGARVAMQSKGFSMPADIANAHLTKKPVSTATRGDVVLHPQGALGLCAGRKSYFLLETTGITEFETLKCIRAWEV